jgi:Fe-S-cluster-containing dehydrogenase component/formate-dependent nitrite reductase membrane component NrfD
MRYGLVIDNRKCIGCHSCTVACKTENRVPLGVNRTWVKYVEKGKFPYTRRVFQVNRCSHCEKPPCVEICPVSAMYKRSDGIVDFNPARCIGCKACMQACPYDAIYVDPVRKTAAKCHLCAHRVEAGMLPACAAVCPERAIICGDLDDPDSEIAHIVARQTVRVRKPEQGTKPKVFYIDSDESTMSPTAARHEAFYMWAERDARKGSKGALHAPDSPLLQKDTLAAYDVVHARPWDWQVPVYFWMKSVGSGLFAVPAIGLALGRMSLNPLRDTVLAALALIFTVATVLLLVSDLSRKDRFLNVLTSPQWKSWLSKGAFFLVLYSALCVGLLLSTITGHTSLCSILLWLTVFTGVGVAGYTAFLFGQCEGRDLWQSPLLLVHLVVQAFLVSAAVLMFLPTWLGATPRSQFMAIIALSITLVLHLLMIAGEVATPHSTDNAKYATWLITRGAYKNLFWIGAVGLGGVVPLLLLLASSVSTFASGLSGVLALGGLLAFEWCFVMAGQRAPNS